MDIKSFDRKYTKIATFINYIDPISYSILIGMAADKKSDLLIQNLENLKYLNLYKENLRN